MTRDARLQWRQLATAQPNVAPLLRQANEGFNNAANAASDILGRYQAGREAAGDAEAAHRLAGINDEAELDAFLAGGGLSDLQISDGMRERLLGQRAATLGFMNDRSIIGNRDGRLAIAQGQEADANRLRDQAYSDDQALRAAAGLIQESQQFRREHGDVVGPITQTGGDAFENYLAATIQSESSGNPNARNPRSSATGLGQFIDSTWQQMMRDHPDLGLTADGRTDPAQSQRALRRFTEVNMQGLQNSNIPITEGNLYAAHFLGLGGARSVLTQSDDTRLVDVLPANVIEANPFLRNMNVGRFREWSSEKGGGNGVQIATPMMQAREQLLAAGLRSDQIDAALSGAQQAGEQRSAELLELETRRNNETLQELTATANQQLLDNPEINTIEDLRRATFADDRFTATENEARYETLRGLIEQDPGRLRPNVSEDPETVALVEGAVEAANAANEANPRFAVFADADRLAATDTSTVGQNVADRLGLDSDPENPTSILGFGESGFDVNQLDRMIEDAARRNNVRPEVAAAAFVRGFERDPSGRNTLSNRFDRDRIDEIIGTIDQRDERDFRESQRSVQVMEQELGSLRSQAQLIRAQLAQYPEGSAQYRALQTQLNNITGQIADVEQRRSRAE
ncbi:hypothetical protein RDp07_gp55 [Roseobacter phage RD-1410Ws-07]|uniref:Transglycosylase SLT domain-containing protein n=2 Tax=Sanyabayvirus DS1410Ws06 TaxID=2844087 RepID=A0A191VYT0_9CAUD|nr:hypothetical protein HYO98_gp58 [Dinoroseobacter phage DS-1410Ws-06]ANJ20715.1 hypothetical protein DSp06_gp58 [Dinoroseobacter phage DS-1410Ws-06]ANJ20866.1 hypothetical protein RDp07_gp55 [Roseobacter phage RD-1410Ws-07]